MGVSNASADDLDGRLSFSSSESMNASLAKSRSRPAEADCEEGSFRSGGGLGSRLASLPARCLVRSSNGIEVELGSGRSLRS